MDQPKTEHRPRERSANEREAFLARLAGGLAHEIKNPLSTMAINLTLLEEEWDRSGGPNRRPPSPQEKRSLKRLQTLKREVSRLEGILDDFLRFARGGEINRSPRDVIAAVKEVLEFVEPENEVQEIRVHVDLPVGLPLVMLDEGAFKQAFLNLLVNARQAMPGGGELIVRVQRSGSYVEISVTDTGVGLAEDELEHCFDLYYSTKKAGTGLGLSTVLRIVEEHAGTVDVVSEEGRGTSFTISLPLVVELARRREGRG